jgi:hypothetical protein
MASVGVVRQLAARKLRTNMRNGAVRRTGWVGAGAIALTLAAGCGGSSSPSEPSGVNLPSGNSRPVIEITHFEMTSAGVGYVPTVTLTEKSGKYAATVQSLTFNLPTGETIELGDSCLGAREIPAGGTWTWTAASYCLDLDRAAISKPVQIIVKFVDGQGNVGQVTGSETTDSSSTSSAVLQITRFQMNLFAHEGGYYVYRPTILLSERSGTSAATLESLTFGMPTGDTVEFDGAVQQGGTCLTTRESRTVPAGGTWNDSEIYEYCLDDLDTRADIGGQQVQLTVRYHDDHGGAATVSALTTVAAH